MSTTDENTQAVIWAKGLKGTEALRGGVQVYFCLVRARVPGPCGPVPVARSRWPGPGGPIPVARSRWPGAVARFRARRPRFCRGPVARSRSRSRPRSLPSVLPMVWWPGVPAPLSLPIPVLAPAWSRWPGPSPNKADHLCSVASFKQSLPGIWWF